MSEDKLHEDNDATNTLINRIIKLEEKVILLENKVITLEDNYIKVFVELHDLDFRTNSLVHYGVNNNRVTDECKLK